MSSEYGWTSQQILDLTYTELNWRLLAIRKRKDEELSNLATLHNKRLVYSEIEENSVNEKLLSKAISDRLRQ